MNDISGPVGLTKDIYAFLSWIKTVVGSNVISSYFRFDGTKVS